MQWIDVKENPPKDYMEAIVFNEKMDDQCLLAKYCSTFELWLWRNPHTGCFMPIDITHYLPIPERPQRF